MAASVRDGPSFGSDRFRYAFGIRRPRRRAAPFHDLNHVVSGYGNDAMGEAEIAAWELASGCKRYLAAWVLNWSALPLGLRSPRRLFAAFVRGRRSANLYDADVSRLLDMPLRAVRAELHLDKQIRPVMSDAVLFVSALVLSPLVSVIPAALSILTSPVWFPSGGLAGSQSSELTRSPTASSDLSQKISGERPQRCTPW